MVKFRLLTSLLLVMLPFLAFAQDEDPVDIDALVEQISAECPIAYGGGWGVDYCHTSNDTVNFEMKTPAVLSAYLEMLTGDFGKVKKLWRDHLSNYVERWGRFEELLVESNRTFVLILRPENSDTPVASIIFSPSDFMEVQ